MLRVSYKTVILAGVLVSLFQSAFIRVMDGRMMNMTTRWHDNTGISTGLDCFALTPGMCTSGWTCDRRQTRLTWMMTMIWWMKSPDLRVCVCVCYCESAFIISLYLLFYHSRILSCHRNILHISSESHHIISSSSPSRLLYPPRQNVSFLSFEVVDLPVLESIASEFYNIDTIYLTTYINNPLKSLSICHFL